MSKIAQKITLTSLSPTISSTHTSDQIFLTLIHQKLKNKNLAPHEIIEVTVFGKKCGFRVEEVKLKSGDHKGEKIAVTEETEVQVLLEGEFKKQRNLSASLKMALLDDLDDSLGSEPEGGAEHKLLPQDERPIICEEVGAEQVDELEQILRFNLCDEVKDLLKLKNVVVCGPEKSGKKTIVRRAISRYWKSLKSSDTNNESAENNPKMQDIFAFKTLSITKESVRKFETFLTFQKSDLACLKALQSFAISSECKVLIIEIQTPSPQVQGQNDYPGQENPSSAASFLLDKIFQTCPEKYKVVLVNSQYFTKSSSVDKVIEATSLNQHSRLKMLAFVIDQFQHKVSSEQIKDIAMRTAGFSIFDLMRLCKSAHFEQFKKSPTANICLEYQVLKQTILKTKPININKLVSDTETGNSQLSFESIGGYDDIKLLLKNQFLKPLTNPEIYIKRGLKPPSGLLLYGPPGCSKTLFAKALASTSYFNFISVKGPEIFSKYVGDSEKTIRDIFAKARVNAPCVVFFDEIDAVGGRRGGAESSGSSNVGERVLLQILTEMDGFSHSEEIKNPLKQGETLSSDASDSQNNAVIYQMEQTPLEIKDTTKEGQKPGDLSSNRVVVIGATNRPDILDDALIRPGRLDTMAYIGLPDEGARRDIFRIQRKTMNWEIEEAHIDEAVKLTSGYTGAEIVQICQKAGFYSIDRDESDYFIRWEDLQKSIKNSKPRITQMMLEKYQKFESSRKN